MPPRKKQTMGKGLPKDIGRALLPHLRNVSADILEKNLVPLLVRKIRGQGKQKKTRQRKLK